MQKPTSLEDMGKKLQYQDPKVRALGLIIQGLIISQYRGTFSIRESQCLSQAVELFSPQSHALPIIPEGSDEDSIGNDEPGMDNDLGKGDC